MGRVQPGGVPLVGTDAQADRIGTAPAVAGTALPAAGSGVGGGPLRFVCTNSGFGLCKEQGEMERAMAKRFQASADNVREYWRLFANRRAYVGEYPRPPPPPLLLPAQDWKERPTRQLERGHHPAAPGRPAHDRAVCYEPRDTALQVDRDRWGLYGFAEASV